MKLFKRIILAVLGVSLATGASAQMVGTDCFLMGDHQEIGIHNNGYEGTSALPAFPTHWRGGPARLAFLCNPDLSVPLWDPEYDGDYIMPGSPEGRFGIEVDGVTVFNSSAVGAPGITPTGLSNYQVTGTCLSVDWDGVYAGIDVHLTYIMDVTKTYYRVVVRLINTNPTDKNNVYFYKSLDPDNNQFIGWGFGTQNTVESQPDPFCNKALVSATQTSGWTSYFGLGALDDNIRVARGSFFVTDASDVYDGVGPMIGIEGSTAFADQAIAICHRDALLGAGDTSQFEFVVIMDEAELEEALKSQYFLSHEDTDPLALCTPILPDTLDAPCSGTTTLEMEGPSLEDYTWTWTNAETGAVVGTGPSIDVTPGDTTHYIVTGSPVSDCFVSDIIREVVVIALGDGPAVDIAPIGPQCNPVPIGDLVITDTEGIPDTFMEFFTEYPDSMFDDTGIHDGSDIGPGDEVWVMIADSVGGCYDVMFIDIEFIEIDAGLDSTGYLLCNSGLEVVDVDSFLVDTSLTDDGGYWYEATDPVSGGFNPVTGIFDPTDVPAGDYLFNFVADGGMMCDNDTATMTVTVYDQPDAGADGTGDVCNTLGFTFDVNTLLSGHDPGGTWTEVTPTGGAFDPTTGILSIDGIIAPGDYDFEYTVFGTAPCVDDVAEFTITINPLPNVNAGPDQAICDGTPTTVNASSFGGTPTYSWTPGGILDGVPFTPAVGTETYEVTATDLNGCQNTDDLEIVVNPLPVISFSSPDLEGCTDFNTDFTVVSDVDIDVTDWTFGDGDVVVGTTSPTVSHTYLYGGTYDVSATVTDVNGCVSSVAYNEYILVEDHPIAAFNFTPQSVYTDDTQVEFSNESLNATDYIWDFGDGSPLTDVEDPTHWFPEDQGDVFYPIELKASNYLNCVDSVTKWINVRGIIVYYIPNTFTPDGDQFNEVFRPVFASGFDPYDFHMVVYNRYGEIVFESFDATGGWDGTYGNLGLAEDGVYTWQIDFKELHTDKRHIDFGHVTILK